MISVTKNMFFDRRAVVADLSVKERRGLSKYGAFVRTRAKRSMRRSKKSAEPGTPPRAHAGQLKNLLYFGYDSSTRSVVIGPQFIGRSIRSSKPIPALLEFGGTASSRDGRRTFEYAAFPYMRPANEAELSNFARCFA